MASFGKRISYGKSGCIHDKGAISNHVYQVHKFWDDSLAFSFPLAAHYSEQLHWPHPTFFKHLLWAPKYWPLEESSQFLFLNQHLHSNIWWELSHFQQGKCWLKCFFWAASGFSKILLIFCDSIQWKKPLMLRTVCQNGKEHQTLTKNIGSI